MGGTRYRPNSRPAPAARTEGFIFQDKGFWFLMWREHGQKRRLGLCTKDEAEARETHRIFLAQGEEAARADVLARKRSAASIWRNRQSRWWYLTAWNDAKTDKVKYALGTKDEEKAKRMLELFKAGKRKEFERMCPEGLDAMHKDADRRRAESVMRAQAAE